jgi:DNA-binding XRE family transcriptional regulator
VGLVTHVPLRLHPDEKSSLQRTATRRHRTQLYEILGSFEQLFRKVTYFAKKRGTPCAARHSRFMPEKSRKLELVVDTEKRLVYTVIWLKLESFRKVCYFAKIFALTICFLSHIICIEKRKPPKPRPARSNGRSGIGLITKARRYDAMGKNFRDTLNERMKDSAFLAEWNAQEPERQIMRAIAEGREEKDMTQKQLAEITGITQADISRLESGTANPSLRTLKRLAAGMGMALKVEFVPIQP